MITGLRMTNKELLTESGELISRDMKARKLNWTGYVARSNSTMNT